VGTDSSRAEPKLGELDKHSRKQTAKDNRAGGPLIPLARRRASG
jgi:hypothetical protein